MLSFSVIWARQKQAWWVCQQSMTKLSSCACIYTSIIIHPVHTLDCHPSSLEVQDSEQCQVQSQVRIAVTGPDTAHAEYLHTAAFVCNLLTSHASFMSLLAPKQQLPLPKQLHDALLVAIYPA